MILQWRLFLTALRTFTRIPLPRIAETDVQIDAAARHMPMVGIIVGAAFGRNPSSERARKRPADSRAATLARSDTRRAVRWWSRSSSRA
jgi:hypothetical protein